MQDLFPSFFENKWKLDAEQAFFSPLKNNFL